MSRNLEAGPTQFIKLFLFTLGFIVLLLCWWVLFWYLAAWTEGVLAPWDIDKRGMPNAGTFPREVNDFFEDDGWWIPSVLSVGLSALLTFLWLIQTNFQRVRVLWGAAGINLGFGAVLFLAGYPAGMLDGLWRSYFSLPDLPHFHPIYIGFAALLWVLYLAAHTRSFKARF